MSASLALDEYISKAETNPAKENEKLLATAYELAKQEVLNSNYSIDSVRLAHKVFGYLGDSGLIERIKLMKKYLQHGNINTIKDKFWANWELVDNLALLKRYKEMIEEQRLFLVWAKACMEQEYWMKVMYDSTQAVGWIFENKAEEWFEIYYGLINSLEPSNLNRESRILYVETAAGLLAFNLQEYDSALIEIDRYQNILYEDKTWSQLRKFSIRRFSYLLEVYRGKKEIVKYDKVINESISEIEFSIKQYNQGLSINIDEICDMAHEIGTCLMWEKRYQQAIPLFEYAIEKQGNGVTHFFYAICIWATQKNRTKTLYHLKMAELTTTGNGGLRARYIHMFLDQNEFSDIRNDEAFLSIFKN
jgi:tetratricopeptide (TPR) repeat protein